LHILPKDGKTYHPQFYNLDAVISVGYRVNSRRGTEFRMWATNVLRSHIIKGYSVNQERLSELKQTLKLAADISARIDLKGDEANAILQSISDYAYALDLLDDYDHQHIRPGRKTAVPAAGIEYSEAMKIIIQLKKMFGGADLFGVEKDQSLYGSLSAIMQTYDGRDLYPSLEEKAAHLLYFLVKNHRFVDGNKRIAAALFPRFMEKNKMLFHDDGTRRIADNALVAMTLMIAISKPEEKEILTSMVVNLIDSEN
jgi:prophage maintenance system killer protein